MSIRPYGASDAEALSALIRTTMRISNAADYPLARLQPLMDYFSPAQVERLNQERICLVAEAEGGLRNGEWLTVGAACSRTSQTYPVVSLETDGVRPDCAAESSAYATHQDLPDSLLIGTAALGGDEILTFFVHPDHQGRGLGSALLAALESTAKARRQTQLTVKSSLTAATFYERQGYRRLGDQLDGTFMPRVPMVKRLL